MSDSIYAQPSGSFEATIFDVPAGLVGTLGYEIVDGEGDVVIARTTAGIVYLGNDVYKATGIAPDLEGSYIIRWDTGGVDPDYGTENLIVTITSAITPSLTDVGSILRARTRSDESGAESGTFSASTRPTATEVLELMEQAESEVIVHCPADLTTLSARLITLATRMVALRTAMLIELSLFPDQSVDSDSIYDKLERDYARLLKTFLSALADGDGANVGKAVMRSVTMTSALFEDGTDESFLNEV